MYINSEIYKKYIPSLPTSSENIAETFRAIPNHTNLGIRGGGEGARGCASLRGGQGGRRTCPAATPSPGPAETTTPTAERASRGETETVKTERTNSPCQKLTDRGVHKIVEYFQKLLKPDPSELFVTAIHL